MVESLRTRCDQSSQSAMDAEIRVGLVHTHLMNGLSFAASLITNLYWPLVVGLVLIVFRKPISALIGRIRSYKGFGQELTFGRQMATAEDSVEEAVQSSSADTSTRRAVASKPSPLAREAGANPSFVVIQSWEFLSSALADLIGAAFPNDPYRGSPVRMLDTLSNREVVNTEFVKAVYDLRDLRNSVAHGQSNPTPGEALAYAESAQELSMIARTTAESLSRNHPDR
jgi:hypothetical protein